MNLCLEQKYFIHIRFYFLRSSLASLRIFHRSVVQRITTTCNISHCEISTVDAFKEYEQWHILLLSSFVDGLVEIFFHIFRQWLARICLNDTEVHSCGRNPCFTLLIFVGGRYKEIAVIRTGQIGGLGQ